MNICVKTITGILVVYLCFLTEAVWGQNYEVQMGQEIEFNTILVRYDPEFTEIVDGVEIHAGQIAEQVKKLLNVRIIERLHRSGIEVWQFDGDLDRALKLARNIPGAIVTPNYIVELERPVEIRPFEPKDETEEGAGELRSAVDKGSIIISGTGSYRSYGGDLFEDRNGNRWVDIRFTPMVNYFVAANISLGGAIDYWRESQGDYKSEVIGIGPAVGYYFGDSESKSIPYLSGGIRYYNIGNGSSISGTDIIIGAGIIFSLNKHLGFIVEGTYHIANLKGKDWNASESGNILMIGIGMAGMFY